MSKKMKDIAESEYSDIAYKLTPQGGIALPLDNRENAKMVESCYKHHSITINPIIDWTDEEVWEFIHEYNVPYCELYDQGYKRLGCIGCPLAGEKMQKEEFEKYPKYYNLYLKAFEKLLDVLNDESRRTTWNSAEDIMAWWLREKTDAEITDILELGKEQDNE